MSNGHEIPTVTPFPLAMVVCDFIYRDPFTGKYTLTGTFSTIAGAKFPLVHPHLHVYAALTGGRGKISVKLELSLAKNDEDELLASVEDIVDSGNDPRLIHELGIAFGVGFPVPGEYRLSLYANSEFMVERRLLAFQHEQGTKHDK